MAKNFGSQSDIKKIEQIAGRVRRGTATVADIKFAVENYQEIILMRDRLDDISTNCSTIHFSIPEKAIFDGNVAYEILEDSEGTKYSRVASRTSACMFEAMRVGWCATVKHNGKTRWLGAFKRRKDAEAPHVNLTGPRKEQAMPLQQTNYSELFGWTEQTEESWGVRRLELDDPIGRDEVVITDGGLLQGEGLPDGCWFLSFDEAKEFTMNFWVERSKVADKLRGDILLTYEDDVQDEE